MNNLRLQIILAGVNKLTAPFRQAEKTSVELAAAIKSTKGQLRALEKSAEGLKEFNALQKNVKTAGDEIASLKNKAGWMTIELSKMENPTKKQADAVEDLWKQISFLEGKQGKEKTRLEELRAQLYKNGVSAKDFAAAENRIAKETDETNKRLDEQRKQLGRINEAQKRLNSAKASYQKAKELQGRLAGNGAAMIATGGTMASPVIAAVKQYADFEDAMKGVAKQVNGARDDNGKLTSTYYDMAKAIKAISERLPSENGAIDIAALVEGAARMGIQGKDNLLAFAETSAKAAKAFELPAGDLAENMGKIANLYKIPIRNIEQLGDTINWLDDNAQSKGSDIIDVLQRMGGVADKLDYKKAAALGSTFLSLGAQSDVAATASIAMVRELSIATMQGERFQEGMGTLGLSPEKMEVNMSNDAMGTIIKVLEKINKLKKEDQMTVTTQLFGKEYGKDAAKLANNLTELHDQLKLVNDEKARGSMQRESDIDADSISAQWALLKAGMANTFSSLGETLRGPLMDILGSIKQVTRATRKWVEENPQLAGGILKALAAVSGIAIAIGGLSLAVAAILGPLALNKLIFSTLGIKVLPILWQALQYGGGVFMWLGRLAMANPIGLLVTALAGAAVLIWQNWDWIKGKFTEFFQWIDEKVKAVAKMAKEVYDALPAAFKTTIEVPKDFKPGAAMPWMQPATAGGPNFVTQTKPVSLPRQTVSNTQVNASINVQTHPGQDAKAIAVEVQKQLDAAQRNAKKQSRSSLSDRD